MEILISILAFVVPLVLIVGTLIYKYRKVNKKVMDIYKEHKFTFIVYILLRTFVIFTMVRLIFNREYYNAFLCFVTLVLLMVPAVISKKMNIHLPSPLEIIILFFIFAAEILGEIASFYTLHQGWDTWLHTINGFLCAAIGFSLVHLLNEYDPKRFKLSPLYMTLMAFCFSMTVAVLWEFGEYTMDHYFLFDAQKDFVVNQFASVYFDETGLNNPIVLKNIVNTTITLADGTIYQIPGYLDIGIIDTIKDMFVNCVGALVFCLIGYCSLSSDKYNFIVSSLVPKRKDKHNN
ncbi:MAG: hypothetical protein Q4B60_04425 [Erysipelotrichaceae bacterium]|nr:hypothetical protein [Erysipelotrichaceae bacterium]